MWILIVTNAVALVGMVVALWQLQRLQSLARAEAAKPLGPQRIIWLGRRGRPTAPLRSPLDEFPEEKSLAPAAARSLRTG